ncbi:hypothetical protein RND81_03G229300 [Saponaria officinalis]|uniref:BZIP domain-containing protein n=1 Tax=Saponaria officinalis TaxID=3572 RepID=A0AAW1MAF7_SAPOF
MLGGCMAKPNVLPVTQVTVACQGQPSLPPKIPSPAPYRGSIPTEKQVDPPSPHSTDALTEEVPSWFEDLLNEPESPANNRSHRRSASDTFAYFASSSSANGLGLGSMMGGPNWSFRTAHKPNFVNGPTVKPGHSHEQRDKMSKSGAEEDAELKALGVSCTTQELDRATVAATEGHNQGDGSENSSGGSDSSQMKPPSAPKPEAKRKQHNARRSRVRKLQYIAELERNAHALQMEGAEVTAQLEFLDQQNMILAMENRALKQRLESLSQEHFLKSLEQELLDREMARLQYLYHLQNVNQHQHRQRQKQAATHRRGRSCDLDSQFARLYIHPPETVAATNGFKSPQRN